MRCGYQVRTTQVSRLNLLLKKNLKSKTSLVILWDEMLSLKKFGNGNTNTAIAFTIKCASSVTLVTGTARLSLWMRVYRKPFAKFLFSFIKKVGSIKVNVL